MFRLRLVAVITSLTLLLSGGAALADHHEEYSSHIYADFAIATTVTGLVPGTKYAPVYKFTPEGSNETYFLGTNDITVKPSGTLTVPPVPIYDLTYTFGENVYEGEYEVMLSKPGEYGMPALDEKGLPLEYEIELG